MAKAKNRIWNFKTDTALIERLKRASNAIDRPAAQIAREAINEKLDELAEQFPQINNATSEPAPQSEMAVAA